MQIFVEIERARLTKQLAKLREEEGKIDEAAEILQEVAVVSFAVAIPSSHHSCYILHSVCAPNEVCVINAALGQTVSDLSRPGRRP